MARRAKGTPARRTRQAGSSRSRTAAGRSGKRPSKKAAPRRKAAAKASRRPKQAARTGSLKKPSTKRPVVKRAAVKKAPAKKAAVKKAAAKQAALKKAAPRKAAPRKRTSAAGPQLAKRAGAPPKAPRLDRVRRTLDETVQTPPSSLDLDRRGSAARTGRAGMADSLDDHRGMATAITGGDADVDVEDAYFTGDGAPGGDNPAPDADVVDDIGKALGVQYEDSEELKSSDKIVERDRHRWEMDPASSEDYKDRK
jgi:hypothetical protein